MIFVSEITFENFGQFVVALAHAHIALVLPSLHRAHAQLCVLQCVSVCCTYCTGTPVLISGTFRTVCCSVLQCVAVCCSVLQCVPHTALAPPSSHCVPTTPISDVMSLKIAL